MGDDPHRTALIPLYHMLVISKDMYDNVLYQKIGWTISDNFFLFEFKCFFLGKIPGFLFNGTIYRFESWKFGCAVKSYIKAIKITLIVLTEDFGLFSGPVPSNTFVFNFNSFNFFLSINNVRPLKNCRTQTRMKRYEII